MSYADVSLVEVSKMGDWKNISQRETEARNARRMKRHGTTAAATGAGILALDTKGAQVTGGAVKRAAKEYRSARQPTSISIPSDGGGRGGFTITAPRGSRKFARDTARASLRHNIPKAARGRAKFAATGAALVAGGVGAMAGGSAKERYNEKRIKTMRAKRAK